MIDAGTSWVENNTEAVLRLPALKEGNAYWLEEPFVNYALEAYKNLSEATPHAALAGREGCNNFVQAQAMIKHAGLRYIQIVAG